MPSEKSLNIGSLFNNLKTSIIGTKTAEIDRSIDSSLSTISKYSSTIQRNDYIDTFKNIVSKTNIDDPNHTFLKDIKETQVELQADSKSASRWGTNFNGEYFAIGVGGALAGRGADLFIIDDPHSEQDAKLGRSDVFLPAWEWF